MLTKNLTPYVLGTKVGSRRPPTPEMTIVVKGTFALVDGGVVTPLEDQPPLTAEAFAEGDEERAGECLYPGDFADWKPRAEWMADAVCHTPGDEPRTECVARVTVGRSTKALRAVGWRAWSDARSGAALSKPIPFTEMPLGWAFASGGPGDERNPVGVGAGAEVAPAVEAIGAPVRSRDDRPEPASFAPVSPAWAARRAMLGARYGREWRRTRAPYYAEDFDYAYFCAAPPDQQIEGWFRGDEEIVLDHLVRGAPRFATRLPGERLRAFVNDDEGRFREVAMRLDTVFLAPESGQVTLVWRGVDAVREDDLEDVKTVLLASEPIDAEPKPVEVYREDLEGFEADPIGLAERLPAELIEVAAQREAAKQGDAPEEDPAIAAMDPLSAKIARAFGPIAKEQQAALRAGLAEAVATKMPEDEASRAEIARARGAGGVDLAAEVAAAAERQGDVPPVPRMRRPGALPPTGTRRRMRDLLAQLDAAEAEIDRADAPLAAAARDLDARGEPVPAALGEQRAALAPARAKIAETRKVPEDPRWSQIDPGYTYPRPLSTDAPGPGVDLTDRDLTGADLRGRDLRGAILDGAILTRADLTGADLTGANLRHAVLFRAVLVDARLAGADLTRANLARASLVGADLAGATVEEAFFEGARLADARLEGAKGAYAVFAEADLSGARARGAELPQANLTEASLLGADLSDAVLHESLFERVRAEGVDLSRADVSRSSFAGADLTAARLPGATAEQATFFEATLDRADLELVRARRAHFTKASLVAASLYGADLRNARFYRAILDRADVARANLYQADLCKARLEGTTMRGATLYEAKLLGARGVGLDLEGAIVTGAVREER